MGFNDWSKRKELGITNSHKFSYSPFSSVSNLSSSASSNAGVIKKSLQITLPEDFGAQVSRDGRIQQLVLNGPAHASAVVQVGDFVQVMSSAAPHIRHHSRVVTLHVTYFQIQVDTRPSFPFMIEIGNKSHTALGMALTDDECACACAGGHAHGSSSHGHSRHREIKIASIQRGSLADRCGFLRPGDVITTVHLNKSPAEIETIPCSVYNSRQLALLLRHVTSTTPSVTFSVIPCSSESNLLSSRTMLTTNVHGSVEFKWEDDEIEEAGESSGRLRTEGQRSTQDGVLHSFCLWKDSSFDDWGFSILDSDFLEAQAEGSTSKGPTVVQEIRRGGPAYLVGLLPGDQILQINDRDVSNYESTILVPMLASLEDALNIVILRP